MKLVEPPHVALSQASSSSAEPQGTVDRAGAERPRWRPVRQPRPGHQIRAVRERTAPRDHRRAAARDRARHGQEPRSRAARRLSRRCPGETPCPSLPLPGSQASFPTCRRRSMRLTRSTSRCSPRCANAKSQPVFPRSWSARRRARRRRSRPPSRSLSFARRSMSPAVARGSSRARCRMVPAAPSNLRGARKRPALMPSCRRARLQQTDAGGDARASPHHRRLDRTAGDPARRSFSHTAPARRRDAAASARITASSSACATVAATSPARCAWAGCCRQAFGRCAATTRPPSATSPAAATARSRKFPNIAPDLAARSSRRSGRGGLRTARYPHKRLVPLIACLSRESPAALKHALSVPGLMSAATRPPIVPLDAAAQREVVRAFAAIADEELIDSVGARTRLYGAPI